MTSHPDKRQQQAATLLLFVMRIILLVFGIGFSLLGGAMVWLWLQNGGWGILLLTGLLGGFGILLIWGAIWGKPATVVHLIDQFI